MKQIARVSVGYYWLILAVYIKSYCKTSISLITMDRTNIILQIELDLQFSGSTECTERFTGTVSVFVLQTKRPEQ